MIKFLHGNRCQMNVLFLRMYIKKILKMSSACCQLVFNQAHWWTVYQSSCDHLLLLCVWLYSYLLPLAFQKKWDEIDLESNTDVEVLKTSIYLMTLLCVFVMWQPIICYCEYSDMIISIWNNGLPFLRQKFEKAFLGETSSINNV